MLFKPILRNIVQTIVNLAPFCMFKAVVAFGPLLKFVKFATLGAGGGGQGGREGGFEEQMRWVLIDFTNFIHIFLNIYIKVIL